jgi:hypothetical protein
MGIMLRTSHTDHTESRGHDTFRQEFDPGCQGTSSSSLEVGSDSEFGGVLFVYLKLNEKRAKSEGTKCHVKTMMHKKTEKLKH